MTDLQSGCSKRVYYSEGAAYKAKREHKRRWGLEMYFYICPVCGRLHLSRKDKKKTPWKEGRSRE